MPHDVDLSIAPGVTLPDTAIRLRFARSSGPGGQNVNKVNTKVTLRLPLTGFTPFSAEDLLLAKTKLNNRINKSGELIIQIENSRSQSRNREIAIDKAAYLLISACKKRKKRIPTAIHRAAKEKRLRRKQRTGEKKRLRGRVENDDY